ncbi:hypothetical protein SDC9_163770 [bioreactor metagenome]|uniref:Uncharacterized protein n=1 Tax=bioreactor metagenome TaxID=1076179 RepID=A0A645FRA9_9ZZZZ
MKEPDINLKFNVSDIEETEKHVQEYYHQRIRRASSKVHINGWMKLTIDSREGH